MSAWVERFSALDWALISVLACSVGLGVWRGLVFELMSLAGWVLAWWAATQAGAQLGAMLPWGTPDSLWRSAAGFVIVFCVTLLACALAARLIRILIAATPLSLPDRLLGAAFGLARGLLLLLLVLTVVQWTPWGRSPGWQESPCVAWLMWLQASVQPWLPADFQRTGGA